MLQGMEAGPPVVRQFFRQTFDVFDLGVQAVLGPRLLATYDVLRRYIWRDKRSGDRMAVRLFMEGVLVAPVKQRRIAALVGVSRQTINVHIAKLESMGWIRVLENELGGPRLYVLGSHDGKKGEYLLRDRLLDGLREDLTVTAKGKLGPQAKISDLSHEDREGIVRVWAKDPVFSSASPVLNAFEDVKLGRHPLSSGGDTPCQAGLTPIIENTEVENPNKEEAMPENSPAHGETKMNPDEVQMREATESVPEPSLPSVRQASEQSQDGEANASSLSEAPSRPVIDPAWMITEPRARSKRRRVVEGQMVLPGMSAESPQDPDMGILRAWSESLGIDFASTFAMSTKSAVIEALQQKAAATKRETDIKQQKVANKARKAAEAREKTVKPKSLSRNQRLFEVWKEEYRKAFPDAPPTAWGKKEWAQINTFCIKHNDDEALVAMGMKYLLRKWDNINARFFKGKGGFPDLGTLLFFDAKLLPEAKISVEYFEVEKEWSEAVDKYDFDGISKDLDSKYKRLKASYEKLGIEQ